MDKLTSVLESILSELQEMNSKLDYIKGDGIYNSISDVCDKLDDAKDKLGEVAGDGIYNSISDVCDKLDSLETTITLGDNY